MHEIGLPPTIKKGRVKGAKPQDGQPEGRVTLQQSTATQAAASLFVS